MASQIVISSWAGWDKNRKQKILSPSERSAGTWTSSEPCPRQSWPDSCLGRPSSSWPGRKKTGYIQVFTFCQDLRTKSITSKSLWLRQLPRLWPNQNEKGLFGICWQSSNSQLETIETSNLFVERKKGRAFGFLMDLIWSQNSSLRTLKNGIFWDLLTAKFLVVGL